MHATWYCRVVWSPVDLMRHVANAVGNAYVVALMLDLTYSVSSAADSCYYTDQF
jgi:hypothetical protein